MKNIFKPIFNTIIGISAYSLLGALFYFESNNEIFFAIGICISAVSLYLYIFHFEIERKPIKPVVTALCRLLC